jgi:hypothetical protein
MGKIRQGVKLEPRRITRGGEWRIFVALSLLTGMLTGGLYLIARNAASSGVNSPDALPIPAITAGDACANFANYWMNDSGVSVDVSVVEGLTNCRLSADGEWFVPTSPRDERLPVDFAMTQDERAETNALRQQLLGEIDGLETTFSTSIERDLKTIYDPRTRPISGHLKDGEMIGRQRSRYTRVVQAYLLAPEHGALADYVGWLMTKKIEAYESLSAACEADPALDYLRTACTAVEDSMSVRFPPWTWDLRNAVSLEEYLAHLVRSNQLPDVQSTLAESPENGFAVADRSPWRRFVG